jgi:protein-L-isoaspartate(D-aspartate) O-methyltransferase
MPTERPFSPALWEQIPAAVQDYIRALEEQVLSDVRPSSLPLLRDLEARRQRYAEELQAVSNLRSAALVRAFATVPREGFLGPGPWQVAAPAPPGTYRTTDDADPRHLYHNVVVAIDATRHLNNGQPGFLAFLLEALELQRGDRVVHIGCGLGYYTAIVAEVVGPAGSVTAIELAPALAARAGTNLHEWSQVTVVAGDGGTYDPGPGDAIFVNAGATHPRPVWLDALRQGGRLLVPLTVARNASGHGGGGVLKITRQPHGLTARFIAGVNIFPCIGARDPQMNDQLQEAFRRGTWAAVQSLRRDPHDPTEACWLHGSDFCLSTAAVPMEDRHYGA